MYSTCLRCWVKDNTDQLSLLPIITNISQSCPQQYIFCVLKTYKRASCVDGSMTLMVPFHMSIKQKYWNIWSLKCELAKQFKYNFFFFFFFQIEICPATPHLSTSYLLSKIFSLSFHRNSMQCIFLTIIDGNDGFLVDFLSHQQSNPSSDNGNGLAVTFPWASWCNVYNILSFQPILLRLGR